MSINITVNKPEQAKDLKHPIKLNLKIKKTLDGNYIIRDHEDIDIIVMPEGSDKKIVTFPKTIMGDHVYQAQERFFSHLSDKGVIDRESIQGGNVYFTMEADLLKSEVYDEVKVALTAIHDFIRNEEVDYSNAKEYMDAFEQSLLDPAEEESTDPDDVEHSPTKGAIRPGMLPYGIYYRYYE